MCIRDRSDPATRNIPVMIVTGYREAAEEDVYKRQVLERDLGTPLLIGGVALGMIFLAGARPVHLAVTVLAAVPLLYMAVFQVAYRRERFFSFLDPWKDAKGSGYQRCV